MYKEYLIIADRPDHSDSKVYWDSTEAEAMADIKRLKSEGFTDIVSHKVHTEMVFSELDGKYLFA